MATNSEPASDAGRTEDNATKATAMGEVIHIDQAMVREHLDRIVVNTVQDTLNALLDAEADTRAGHYTRQLHTKAGEVTLKVPKLRSLSFKTAIIERYKRRERSVEEALLEMYYAGVSMRRWRTSPRRCGARE